PEAGRQGSGRSEKLRGPGADRKSDVSVTWRNANAGGPEHRRVGSERRSGDSGGPEDISSLRRIRTGGGDADYGAEYSRRESRGSARCRIGPRAARGCTSRHSAGRGKDRGFGKSSGG